MSILLGIIFYITKTHKYKPHIKIKALKSENKYFIKINLKSIYFYIFISIKYFDKIMRYILINMKLKAIRSEQNLKRQIEYFTSSLKYKK